MLPQPTTIKVWQAGEKWYATIGAAAATADDKEAAIAAVLASVVALGWSNRESDYVIEEVK